MRRSLLICHSCCFHCGFLPEQPVRFTDSASLFWSNVRCYARLHTLRLRCNVSKIALYRLQLQDAAIARASSVVDEARGRVTELAAAHKHYVTEIEQSERRRDQAQDVQPRRQIEKEGSPRDK